MALKRIDYTVSVARNSRTGKIAFYEVAFDLDGEHTVRLQLDREGMLTLGAAMIDAVKEDN